VWAIDRDGHTSFVNPRMADMLAYGETEMLGMPFLSFLDAADLPRARLLLQSGQRGDTAQVDLRFFRKDGRPLITAVKSAPILGDGAEYLGSIASVTDITEQRNAESTVRELQEQLLQSQKMEAIGRLAGGVAHDFNNLLTTILGCAEMIRGDEHSPSGALEYAGEIEKAGRRAAALTRQLLAFSRKQLLKPIALDLNALLYNLAKMLRILIGEDIELRLRLAADLGTVRADPGQIEQVIINLAANARDAMPAGGRLTVETSNTLASNVSARNGNSMASGEYVLLSVADTGSGMNDQVKSHLFEPFFTTKEQGKGTGLGLPSAYGIIRQSNGYMDLESEPGRGTTARIYLPRINQEADPAERFPPGDVPAGGSEAILLVEDEPTLLLMATKILQGFGYRVRGARLPSEALDLVRREDVGPFDLLIADVVLPEMKGTELADRIRREYPKTKVLYTSAHTEDKIIEDGILSEGVAFLQKPFTVNEFGRKVREVLDAASGASADFPVEQG
jgi:PAS domain S-box-containing protein